MCPRPPGGLRAPSAGLAAADSRFLNLATVRKLTITTPATGPNLAASLALLRELAAGCAPTLTDAQLTYLQAHARFIVAVVGQYRGRGVVWEQLLAAGQQGLLRAWDAYDGHPARLNRTGAWWVRQAMLEAL